MHSGIACLASQAPDWAVAFWDLLTLQDAIPMSQGLQTDILHTNNTTT